ncbi:MAG TPA: hypothetical protein PLH03_07945 [Methylophilaceae bacterium]|nr:hypothetical protein [Methylophilaceae bacterium]
MKKAVAVVSLALSAALAVPVYAADQADQSAQTAEAAQPTKEQQKIALDKLKADKKFITSENLALTEAEAKGFWPIYDEYQDGLEKLNQRTLDAIGEYADLYRNNTMTDAKALVLVNKFLAIESDELALKKSTLPKVQKVLPGIKEARYFQIENKLRAIVKIKLAEAIPLVK